MFELSQESHIINPDGIFSGFGKNISSKAELISRLTASQSTLTINDTSVTKFERNKLINKIENILK